VDLGAGAGFPGMVAAILSSGQGRNGHFILVEVDRRKAEFLRTVSRETKVPVTVIEERAEECLPLAADIVSARALAPLELLLSYAQRHLKAGGTGIFLKGASYQDEINTARRRYRFDVKSVPSITESAARVLVVRGIKDV
jgi:16S rRNA (guanine527-N7)-methyltransferase